MNCEELLNTPIDDKLQADMTKQMDTPRSFEEIGMELLERDYVSKDKIKQKIEEFKIISQEIRKLDFRSIHHDITRNDYAVHMLEELLK